jgi:hypothetical protein
VGKKLWDPLQPGAKVLNHSEVMEYHSQDLMKVEDRPSPQKNAPLLIHTKLRVFPEQFIHRNSRFEELRPAAASHTGLACP